MQYSLTDCTVWMRCGPVGARSGMLKREKHGTVPFCRCTRKGLAMSEETTWAEEEFGAAQMGDVRRTHRLVELAEVLGAQPHASLPQATEDAAQLKATYRFFESGYVEPDAILASHAQATIRRMQDEPVVLAVQDTTLLDYTQFPEIKGLGPLASSKQRGLLAHTTLAITPDRVPLGLLAQAVWARDSAVSRDQDHKTRPVDEKESQKWIDSLHAAIAARALCPNTQIVSVGDREADVYDLFMQERPEGVDLLVRAAQDRKVDSEEGRLWPAMKTARLAATVEVDVGERKNQPARFATLEVRFREVTLRPPKSRAKERLPCIKVWAIWAVETRPPAGGKAIEWLLLTTIAIETTDDALTCLAWYAVRWGIEVWHKVLKSGCQIEQRRLATAFRLTTCLALYSVIAWRIMYATMLSRTLPDAPCTMLLDDAEWKGLYCRIHRVSIVPAKPPSLRQAVRWIGQLGGFQGRKGDGEPGIQALWKGFQRLAEIAEMYRIMQQPHQDSPVGSPEPIARE
ncbi:MAG: IS4 family transposase [Candidatus Viridilinea halotolerans]|uniref:IS4 family transposase n=1 Tax=Candidatus Viridilinea halotolerans TaxID=2491704 RepID=A0A426TY45_9CHLR|nr:MAG: IS4 family transposase [Candidatus Viridilinea halotolerans]